MKDALKDSLVFSYNHRWSIATLLMPYLVAMLIISLTVRYFAGSFPSLLWLEFLLIALLQPVYLGRLIKYINKAVNHTEGDLFISIQEWWRLFLVYILYSLAVLFGLVLLILPGICFAIRLGFSEFYTILDGKSPLDSIERSWESTRSCFWPLVGGGLLLGTVSLALDRLMANAAGWVTTSELLAGTLSQVVSVVFMVLMTVFFFRIFDGINDS
ncbi:hypothetical protein [Endozoicomonas sp. Mp262]|uniref:hypothetical protein n=1 Tax=Endozoicomonas sp. Mp262 TaxID=2919499 RepID=UPI0021DB3FF6